MNHTAAYEKILRQNDLEELEGFNEEVVKNTLAMQEKDQLAAPKNSEEFDKFFTKRCKEPI